MANISDLDYKLDRCYYCKRVYVNNFSVVKEIGKPLLKTKDHIIPSSRGGKNDISNYISCCCDCNALKGNMHPKEFAIWLSKKMYDKTFVCNLKPLFKFMIFNSWKLYNKKVALFRCTEISKNNWYKNKNKKKAKNIL